jgi:poly-gamma-glutamate capsule biosynthesis protein CapA/YwtB (metallophosphatase superfamily)
MAGVVAIGLCGDVMTGRGVDQVLPHPGDPELHERYVRDARRYVELAERAHGPIPWPVDFAWPWGVALQALDDLAPDLRLINLETTITASGDFAPGKCVHYRMNPHNLPCLSVFGPDVCSLANNHVLDFGPAGLESTVDALTRAGLACAGAGRARSATRPVIVRVTEDIRVVVLACGAGSSGIPSDWAATPGRIGVYRLADLSDTTAAEVLLRVHEAKHPRDISVVSIHWGSNWGYGVGRDQRRFAHRLLDGGIDIIYGHSSHHPRPIEIYHGKLVLYGCGDFVDDYEGIAGYENYRDDLRLIYVATVAADTGRLARLRLAPLQARKMRLQHASAADIAWLHATLDRVSHRFDTRVDLEPDGTLTARSA